MQRHLREEGEGRAAVERAMSLDARVTELEAALQSAEDAAAEWKLQLDAKTVRRGRGRGVRSPGGLSQAAAAACFFTTIHCL